MIQQLNIDSFLNAPYVCCDVRSPSEYSEGSIPDSANLPLLNNENRKTIGICYKQNGKDAAIKLGYQLVNPIKQHLIDQLKNITTESSIKLYCARGGLRSNKMAEFLDAAGFNVSVLKGGYKAYRNHILKSIESFKNIFILAGNTGCGKTEILAELKQKGEQVLNLEQLANHKGSAFGTLGEQPQPTNMQFSNLVFNQLKNYDPNQRLWVESESINIGKVGLPEELWKNMLVANGIEIVLPIEERVNFIVNRYGPYGFEALKQSLQKLYKRFGEKEIQTLSEQIDRNELHAVVIRLLKYYDKGYLRSREKTNCHNFVKFNLKTVDATMNSQLLLQHLQFIQ